MKNFKNILFLFLISTFFVGCISNDFGILYTKFEQDKADYNKAPFKSSKSINEKKQNVSTIKDQKTVPLTANEDKQINFLTKKYFENTNWTGFLKIDGIADEYLTQIRFNELKSEGPFNQLLNIKIFDNKRKNETLLECDNINMIKNEVDTFIINLNYTQCRKNKMLPGILAFNRTDMNVNMFSGIRFYTQANGAFMQEGHFYIQRDAKYKLPIIKKIKNIYANFDDINLSYNKLTDSKVFFSVNGNENNNDPFGKMIKLDDKTILNMSKDYINIWDIYNNNISKRISFQREINNIGKLIDFDLSSDKRFIAVIGSFDGPLLTDKDKIYIYDLKNEKITKFFDSLSRYPQSIKFTDDGKYLICSYETGIVGIWDFNKETLVTTLNVDSGEVGYKKPLILSQKFEKDYNIFITYRNKLQKYSLNSEKLLDEYLHAYPIRTVAKSKKYIVIASQAEVDGKIINEINVLNDNLEIVKSIDFDSINPSSNIFFNQEEDKLIITSLDTIMTYDIKNNFKELTYYNKDMLSELKIATVIDFDKDNILYQDSITKYFYKFNINTQKIVEKYGNDNLSIFAVGLNKNSIGFSRLDLKKDVNKNFHYNFDKALTNSFNIDDKKFEDLKTEYFRDKKENSNYYVKAVLSSVYQAQVLELYKKGFFSDSKVAELKKSFDKGELHLSQTFYKDYIISSGISELTVYDYSGNIVSKLLGQEGYISGLAVDGDKLITSSFDGSISLWDLSKLENNKIINPTISLLITNDNEWVMWTPQGYFNSSENGYKYIGFHINQGFDKEAKWVGIEKLYDHFYRPDLVELALKGEDITPYTKGLSYKDVLKNPAPQVQITKVDYKNINTNEIIYKKDEINLEFNVNQIDNGGVGIIRIYQEGKLVKTIGDGEINRQTANALEDLESQKINQQAKQSQEEYLAKFDNSVTKSMNGTIEENELIDDVKVIETSNNSGVHKILLPLKSGINKIEIEAFNKSNSVASIREKLSVDAKIKKRESIVYAIIAGVDNFEDTKRFNNLKYSQNDAKSINEVLKTKVKEKVVSTLLLGENFTKEKLFKAINDIKSKAKLEDKIIFYVSTHGKAFKGDLHLIPQNNKYAKNFIKFDEMFKEIQSISALDQIFVIDACESGQAKDIVSSVYDSKASVLAKQTGVHVLLATAKGTFAFEHPNPNIKHGVFTNNILTALESKKTDENGDKKISILELSKVLRNPEFITEYQYPIIRNVGQDTKVKDF